MTEPLPNDTTADFAAGQAKPDPVEQEAALEAARQAERQARRDARRAAIRALVAKVETPINVNQAIVKLRQCKLCLALLMPDETAHEHVRKCMKREGMIP